jgi:hypothetical protein
MRHHVQACPLSRVQQNVDALARARQGRRVMYTASCHCGAVRLELQRKPRQLTQCNCSLCRRYGALWAYFQRKRVQVLAKPSELESYSWRDKRFAFFRCATCGCVTHYQRTMRRADGSDMGAVNLRNIDDPAVVAHVPIRLLDGASSWKVLGSAPQTRLLGAPDPDRAA